MFAQIGDGAIVVANENGTQWSSVFWPQHGEFANTTNFVVSLGASELLEFFASDEAVNELAVFSDGIENLVLNQASKSAHSPFFNSMFVPVRKLEISGLNEELSAGLATYLESQAICDRTDDDKSLVLASRAPQSFELNDATAPA